MKSYHWSWRTRYERRDRGFARGGGSPRRLRPPGKEERDHRRHVRGADRGVRHRRARPDIGAVVIAGRGGVFTAGNDIVDFLSIAAAGARASHFANFPAGRFVARLAELGKPLIAAVDGLAVGIGTTLCFHCDLVYATPAARFLMPFVNLGLVPEAGSSMLAPLRFGRARAAEFLMLAEPFDGEAAVELGFVNALVAADALLAHALGKAAALAAKPRSALLATRRLHTICPV